MSQASYADLILPLLDAMAGPYEVDQVILRTSRFHLLYALSAPITQFIYITMRPLHDVNYELVPLLDKLQKGLQCVPGCVASCWGPSTEKDKLEIGVIGWRSIQVNL